MAPDHSIAARTVLAMPPGREDDADAFYAGVLGLTVVPKPAPLAARGGRWYAGGEVTVRLGVDPAFTPARRAHPAFIVAGLSDLVAELALEKVGVFRRLNSPHG